jgi:hypothetical protein
LGNNAAVPLCWWCAVLRAFPVSSCKRRAYPCRHCNVIGSCPRIVGRFPACSAASFPIRASVFAAW